jgi:D-glycero-alpha-D-manno-heptose-7-phosphate kinase
MIITRTPFRISFFGGGTDYPVWYRQNSGVVINTSINKYCYITVRYLPPFFDFKHRIRYYITEEVKDVDEIKHPSVRECLKFLNIHKGVEIVHTADLPAQSGLGSSSTFTVGLLNALYALKNYMATKKELALNAIHVEQNLIKENVGSQDQTIAAFGGFNKIEFNGAKEITVQPIITELERCNLLQERLMLFFTGYARNADEIASEQIRVTPTKNGELNAMVNIVEEAYNVLRSKNGSINDLGKLLDEQWKIKRALTAKITNDYIDEIYNVGRKAGALGGKLLGAGGGGFMLFYADPKYHKTIKNKLKKLTCVPFRFDNTGSQIVYHSHDNNF